MDRDPWWAVLGTATVLAALAWFVLRALFGPPSGDSYETGGAYIPRPELGEGWDFDDEAEMRARYPRLTATFSS